MEKLQCLLFNISLTVTILTISISISKIFPTKKKNKKLFESIYLGIIFGIGVLISMANPFSFAKGIFIDSRTIFINLATLLFGGISGIFPTIASILYRIYKGGTGMTGGVLLSLSTYIISLFFLTYSKEKKGITLPLIFFSSLSIHLVMVLLMLGFINRYLSVSLEADLFPLILLVYPLITAALGLLFLEYKKWDSAQKESEIFKAYMHALLNNVNEIVISVNSENKIIFANEKAKQLLKRKNPSGLNIQGIISILNNNKQDVLTDLLKKTETEKRIYITEHFLKIGEETIPIEGNISTFSSDSYDRGILFSFVNITRKIENEKMLNEVLERITDGIESYDNKWDFTFANKQAGEILQRKIPPEKLIGKNKWKIEPEAVGTKFYNACKEAQQTQKPIFMEHYFKPWDKWFENRIYPSEKGITVFFTDITEKKKLEEKINKINQNFQTIFNLTPAIMFAWDTDSRKTTFVSENIATILGYTKEEAMADNWWRGVTHKEDYDKAFVKSNKVLVDGKSEQQFRVFKQDGSIAWILEKQILAEDKEQGKKTVYGIWVDITESKKVEEELKEQKETFKHLFENEFVPMLLIDPVSLNIVEANKAASRLYGYSQEIFRNGFSVNNLHMEPFDKNLLKQNGKPIINIEAVHKKSSGEKVFVEIYGIPFRQKEKEYVFVIIHDITEKKQTEKELIEAESKFFLAFQSSPIGTAISKLSNGKFIDVNPAFEKISGYSKQEILGKTSVELNLWINPEDREDFIEELKKEKMVLNKRIAFRNKKGERIHTLTTSFIFKEKFMFSYIVNITDLVNLQNELEIKVRERTTKLEELNEELKEFTQSLVHDLKEPLRTIKNFSEMILQEEKSTPASLKKNLSFIYSASQHLEKMVNELYEYSKLGKETFTLSMVSLDRAMDNVFKMLQTLIKETCTEITIPEELGMVYGNNALITRILQNLIDNAIKFRREGVKPKITITSTKTRSTLTLTISDNGKGIKKDYLNKVFYPFAKAGNEDYEGLGMGLAIVKKSMEIMGGEVKIKSDLNQGTQVSLIFRI